MGTLHAAIDEYMAQARASRPADIQHTMAEATRALKEADIEQAALRAGDKLPDFALANQHGETKRVSDYLADGPLVLNIYRGGWCPYCNMEMKALHDVLPQIRERGANLVGMSPETPDKAELSAVNNELDIDILSDAGNQVAQQMGLVFVLPESLRPIYEKFGLDLPAYNGDQSFRLPMPASYIISQDGTIVFDFVDADYTRRLEPAVIVDKLDLFFR